VEKTTHQTKFISMDAEEISSFYRGIELLKKSGYGLDIIYGLTIEEEGDPSDPIREWTTTTIEFSIEGHENPWHCHGIGDTPEEAIEDTIKQLKNNNI
jgi:hypothetical protein